MQEFSINHHLVSGFLQDLFTVSVLLSHNHTLSVPNAGPLQRYHILQKALSPLASLCNHSSRVTDLTLEVSLTKVGCVFPRRPSIESVWVTVTCRKIQSVGQLLKPFSFSYGQYNGAAIGAITSHCQQPALNPKIRSSLRGDFTFSLSAHWFLLSPLASSLIPKDNVDW